MSTTNNNALTYNSYVSQIGVMAVVVTQTVGGIVVGVDDAFNAIIPQMLSYAELRIQRDLDLLPALTSSVGYGLTAANNQVQVSVNDFVTLESISVVVGTQKIPLLPVSKEFLQNVYNDTSYLAQPMYSAMYGGDQTTGGNTYNNILVGPIPDVNYPLLITGVQRLPSLYSLSGNSTDASTGTTFISTNLPDLLIFASMIFISAYQRNFGKQSDDPSMAISYESQYQTLLKGAQGEEFRKKWEASAWSSSPTPPAASRAR